jgi:hypothetical protein
MALSFDGPVNDLIDVTQNIIDGCRFVEATQRE